jgi:hypothetical protein
MASTKGTGSAPQWDDSAWETDSAASGTKVSLDTVGDVFTGIKTGQEEIPNNGEPFTVYTFTALGMTAHGLEDGEVCSITESYKLRPLADIANGRLVRIERMKDVPITGRPEPMKDYDIKSQAWNVG